MDCKKVFVLFVLVTLMGAARSQSTNRTEVFIGVSNPELLHAGIRFQIHQFQPGISFGTFPTGLSNGIHHTYSFDLNYHFAWKSEVSSFKKLFFNAGYLLYKYENNDFVATEDLLKLRFGIKMNAKAKLGVELDGGVGILTRHVVKQYKSGKTYIVIPFTPCVGVRLFYNLSR